MAEGQKDYIGACVTDISIHLISEDEKRAVGIDGDVKLVLDFDTGGTLQAPVTEAALQKLKKSL